MTLERRIKQKLMLALEPTRLDVVNESHLHAGHGGDDGSGQTHFRVLVVAPGFQGKSRLERHRMVNAAVSEEFADGVHALAVTALTPAEAAAR